MGRPIFSLIANMKDKPNARQKSAAMREGLQ